jgi:hypothetical protein
MMSPKIDTPGVVHPGVDPAELLHGRRRELLHVLLAPDVRGDGEGSATVTLDLLGQGLDGLPVACREDHGRAHARPDGQ